MYGPLALHSTLTSCCLAKAPLSPPSTLPPIPQLPTHPTLSYSCPLLSQFLPSAASLSTFENGAQSQSQSQTPNGTREGRREGSLVFSKWPHFSRNITLLSSSSSGQGGVKSTPSSPRLGVGVILTDPEPAKEALDSVILTHFS